MSGGWDELDDRVDLAREALAEFARIEDEHGYCELCDRPCVGNICRVCDLWSDGLYDENRWTYDEGVRNG